MKVLVRINTNIRRWHNETVTCPDNMDSDELYEYIEYFRERIQRDGIYSDGAMRDIPPKIFRIL